MRLTLQQVSLFKAEIPKLEQTLKSVQDQLKQARESEFRARNTYNTNSNERLIWPLSPEIVQQNMHVKETYPKAIARYNEALRVLHSGVAHHCITNEELNELADCGIPKMATLANQLKEFKKSRLQSSK
jgi:hypothetical protein